MTDFPGRKHESGRKHEPGKKCDKVRSNLRRTNLMFQVWCAIILLSAIVFAAVSVYFNNFSSCLFRDLFLLARVPVYFGLFSNLGVFCWCVAATVSLFTAAVALPLSESKKLAKFLLCSGLLTLWLAIDDFFMLHEYLIPIRLGIAEEAIFVVYGAVTALYFLKFQKIFLRTNLTFFVIALIFLGASLGIDKFLDQLPFLSAAVVEQEYLIEDGLKLLGIITWLFYFVETSLATVNSLISDQSKENCNRHSTG